MKALLQKFLGYCGYELRARDYALRDLTPEQRAIVSTVRPFTMTSLERIVAAVEATEYIAANAIPGEIVECGVWRGGSMMAMALTLLRLQKNDRDLYLFDTFEGMTRPSDMDGTTAQSEWKLNQTQDRNNWCYASLDEVKQNMASTNYSAAKIHFVKGKVEDTLHGNAPETIALLRLDTDWYESTLHELEILYPRLSPGGVLIIDDYGQWQGCRRAVNEYFLKHKINLLLHRIDATGRIAIKGASSK